MIKLIIILSVLRCNFADVSKNVDHFYDTRGTPTLHVSLNETNCQRVIYAERTPTVLLFHEGVITCVTRIISTQDNIYASISNAMFGYGIENIYDGPSTTHPRVFTNGEQDTYSFVSSSNVITIEWRKDEVSEWGSFYGEMIIQGVDRLPNCSNHIKDCDAIIESSEISESICNWTTSNRLTMICKWNITCPGTKFKLVSMKTYPTANDCQSIEIGEDSVCFSENDIYDRSVDEYSDVKDIKVNVNPNSTLNFKYFITIYSDMIHSQCPNGWFNCKNGKCVDQGLLCNGRNNCGNNHDEDVCNSDWWRKTIEILVVVLIIAVLILLYFVLYQNRRKSESNNSVYYNKECLLIDA